MLSPAVPSPAHECLPEHIGPHTLDEECFNRQPLTMAGKSKLRWGGVGGRTLSYDAVTVTSGTKAGVMWRKNPVPRAYAMATWSYRRRCSPRGKARRVR